MANDNIAPINHSAGSAFSSTAAGVTGGAIKGGVKWGLVWTGLLAAAGIASGIALGGIAAAPILLGLVGGGVVGFLTSPAAGVIGSAFGALGGGSRAAHRVREERGAAHMLDAQVEAYKAQVMAPQPAAYANKYAMPEQGSAMNPAASTIQADSLQSMGRVDAPQLQRA